MKILTIVGARPQFIKSYPISTAFEAAGLEEVLLHTGQHYDERMSGQFFSELGLRKPDVNLGVGSGSHGAQTGAMLKGIEDCILSQRPDWVLVYGDTNSTLAGALAAAKLHVPVAHVEAGLRSHNKRMPEETNRLLTDHVSTLLLCPSPMAVAHLNKEGINEGVHVVGDVMADALRTFVPLADQRATFLQRNSLEAYQYHLCTIHRAENTDSEMRLTSLIDGLGGLSLPVCFPIHPRTRGCLEKLGVKVPGNVRLVEPLGYLDMIQATRYAKSVLTDSGGLQKEAYWLRTPCITLRDETEWTETLEHGWNTLVGCSATAIKTAANTPPGDKHPELYGDGHAARRIAALLANSEPPCP